MIVVGILILVALYKSWEIHGSKSRITKAVLLAVLLLPMQVILGALTVVKFELFSRGDRILFEPLISVSHNAIGVVILVSLFAAMLWEREL